MSSPSLNRRATALALVCSALPVAAVALNVSVPTIQYSLCSTTPGVGPSTFGGQVMCNGQTYWVADNGNNCASLAVTGTGWSVVTPCAPFGGASSCPECKCACATV